MKIGIYGGSFDPIHNGHIYLAGCAKKEFNLDKIIFVPCNIPPYKNKKILTPALKRVGMIYMGINKEVSFELDLFELIRNEVSYTIDTVKYFKEKFPKDYICFIFGPDAYETFKTWKDYKEIQKLVDLRFAERSFMKDFYLGVRATDIRKLIKRDKSIKGLVNREVEEFIIKNGLYKEV
ncbi:hypothetical protein LCGC14_2210350 [marine sediment metagenome]|uniref:Cytidyltransferase-like domain-containing protein n=1 Tax=marine sediment metagenome TaxID=412755 RepID=A0A0F9E1G4_9ZZZZ